MGYRCVGCGEYLPEDQIGITGRCRVCWEKYLEEHDLQMRTIIWRETGEVVLVDKYADRGLGI